MDNLQALKNRMILESSLSSNVVVKKSTTSYIDVDRILKQALSTLKLDHRLSLEGIHDVIKYEYTPIMCYECPLEKEHIKDIANLEYAVFQIYDWIDEHSPEGGESRYLEGGLFALKRENGKFDHLLIFIEGKIYYAFAELSW